MNKSPTSSCNPCPKSQGNFHAKSSTAKLSENKRDLREWPKKSLSAQNTAYSALIYKTSGELVPKMSSVKEP
jgi:hypothetical protein